MSIINHTICVLKSKKFKKMFDLQKKKRKKEKKRNEKHSMIRFFYKNIRPRKIHGLLSLFCEELKKQKTQ